MRRARRGLEPAVSLADDSRRMSQRFQEKSGLKVTQGGRFQNFEGLIGWEVGS